MSISVGHRSALGSCVTPAAYGEVVTAAAESGATHGRFPFGRPNTARPVRPATGDAELLVILVYLSAFHVAWSPPLGLDPRPESKRSRPFVGSLAVDVEPVVFWDGQDPSPAELLDQWKAMVDFDPERDGSVRVGTNGPSGAELIEHYLEPLGVTPSAVAYTDAVPWYFVKHGKGSQGKAVERYNELAAELGRLPADLPKRPTRAQIRDTARHDRFDSLREEIVAAGADRVITLGQEALDAVRVVADDVGDAPVKLVVDGYGESRDLTIDGTTLEWVPLVHPGFLRQTKSTEWRDAVAGWKASVR